MVDNKGKALSKSLKNYTPIDKVLQRSGAEILRLWVAQTDYRDDIKVSDEIIKRSSETYRKVRNTCRFMLGVIDDFDPSKDSLAFAQMEELDLYALSIFEKLRTKVLDAYEKYEFHTVYHAINQFITVDSSAFFLDIHKDRLYCEEKDSKIRRSAQTAIFTILDGLVRPDCADDKFPF